MRSACIAACLAALSLLAGCASPPLPADVTLSPDPVDFGPTFVGELKGQAATIANDTAQPISVDRSTLGVGSVFLRPPGPAHVDRIAARSSAPFPLGFKPPAPGRYEGTWHLTLDGVTHTIELKGEGVLSVTGDRVLVSGVDSGDGMDFGAVQVGDTEEERARIANGRAQKITVPAAPVVTGSGFALHSPATGFPMDVPPAGALNVRVRFTPPGLGHYTGELVVTDDQGAVVLRTLLQGVGVPPEESEGD